MRQLADYEQKALLYSEKFGIIEYEVTNNIMTYFEKACNGYEWETTKCTLNLNTMKETRVRTS